MLRVLIALSAGLAAAAAAKCDAVDEDHCFASRDCLWDGMKCVDGTCRNIYSYPSCKAKGQLCAWDWAAEACLNMGEKPPCNLFYDEQLCPSDCTWDSQEMKCLAPGQTLPCGEIATQPECTANADCKWLPDGYCDLKNGPCSSNDQSTCAAQTGCKWYETETLCWPSDINVPCNRQYNTCSPETCDKVQIGDDATDTECLEKGQVPRCYAYSSSKLCPETCSWDANEMSCTDPNQVDCNMLIGAACAAASSECKQLGETCLFKEQPVKCFELIYSDAEACNSANGCEPDCKNRMCNTCADPQNCKAVDPCPVEVECGNFASKAECDGKSASCYWEPNDQGYCVQLEAICNTGSDEAACAGFNTTYPSISCFWSARYDMCDSEPPIPEVPDDGKPCSTKNIDTCPYPRCTLSDLTEACVDMTCSGLDEDACLSPPAGLKCELIGQYYCNTVGNTPPCYAYDEKASCPARCSWFDDSGTCEKPDDGTPCDSSTSVDTCYIRRCDWDWTQNKCMSKPCSEWTDEKACAVGPCTWSVAYGCSAKDDNKACDTHGEQMCPAPRCEWDSSTRTCGKRQCNRIFNKEGCSGAGGNCQWADNLEECVSDDGSKCDTYMADTACVPTRCIWDYSATSCRKRGCSDLFKQADCTSSELACEWDADSSGFGTCRKDTGAPCDTIASDDCPLHRCAVFSKNDVYGCHVPSCDKFDYTSSKECNGSPLGCEYNAKYSKCLKQGDKLPCDLYDFNEVSCDSRADCSFDGQGYKCYPTADGLSSTCTRLYSEATCTGHGCTWTSDEQCIVCKDCTPTATTTTSTTTTTTAAPPGPTPSPTPPPPGPTPPPPGPTPPPPGPTTTTVAPKPSTRAPRKTTTAAPGSTTKPTPAASGGGGGGIGGGDIAAIIISVLVIAGGIGGFMYYRRHKSYDVSVTMSNIDTRQDSMDVRNFM